MDLVSDTINKSLHNRNFSFCLDVQDSQERKLGQIRPASITTSNSITFLV